METTNPSLQETIRERAFALWVQGGKRAGNELADWLEAERQVQAEAAATKPARRKRAPRAPRATASKVEPAATKAPRAKRKGAARRKPK
jgi:hypothetical protein